MTNEKAIEELSVLYERYSKASENRTHTASTGNYGMIDGQYVEALDLAIKALEQPSYKSDARRWKRRYLDLKQRIIKLEEQQPCEDCISRQMAIDVVRKWFDKIQLNGDICLDGIISLPSVTPKTEPCEDAISRATLLEELGEEPFNWNDSPEAIQEVRDYQWFKSLVENAPLVTPKQTKWIPVSERLPEDIKPVIVTWKNTDPKSYYQYIVGKHFIGTAHYKDGKWFWYSSVTEDLLAEYGRCDGEEFDEAIEVIAWMSLPQPYKAESEE